MTFVNRLFTSPTGNALLVSLLSFVVYLKTLAPSVTFIDSGELAAVACTLGIAHPTGYPLFTLLGWFFSALPLASEEIVRLNIMAAFFCALGIFFFYRLVHFILSGTLATATTGKSRRKEDWSAAIRVASASASFMLAFSETYWSQAVAVEVYSLHVVLLSVVMFSFLKATYDREWNDRESGVWWYAFAFALGLSFTNHMTTVLLAPGLLYLYFATQGFDSSSWKRIGAMFVPFLAGFSVYLYLPFRAAHSPLLNWGNPATLEKFIWHWTGKQYRVWIFSSTGAAEKQLKYFVESLPFEFAYIGLLVALVGVVAMWRAHRKIALTVLLFFFGCVLYSMNYDIHDIDSYFLLAYVAVALCSAAGFFVTCRWLQGRTHLLGATIVLLAVGVAPLGVHYKKTNETENHLVEDYTMNMFSSLQPNALVLSYQWDYWVSASYYYQFVRDYRPDVAVVDKELLRRSWYFNELAHRYPWLIENSRAEVDAFLKELYKFEHEIPYDATIIESRYADMIKSLISKNLASRPVYVTTEIEPAYTTGFQRVPEGLAMRVYADTLRHAMREVEFRYRSFERSGRLEDALKDLYANALVTKGLYALRGGNVEAGKKSMREALAFNPNSREARSLLMQLR